jgi:hypothetical protein
MQPKLFFGQNYCITFSVEKSSPIFLAPPVIKKPCQTKTIAQNGAQPFFVEINA